MTQPRVLVTGANGFVGRRLCAELTERGYRVRVAVRDVARVVDLPRDAVAIGNMHAGTDWSAALQDVDVVIHLAGRVHVMHETASDPDAAFRAINVVVTETLAKAAVSHSVGRFVYVSSVKVNGEATPYRPYTPADPPAPVDAYGISKWEAERALWAVARSTGLEVTVARPPLVYGAGVRGNFLRLIKMIDSGLPLPFSAVDNRRSMIYNGNLAHVLIACAIHPRAAGKTYLVSDCKDISTPELVRKLARALGKKARLVPVPIGMLRFAGALAGKAAEIDRLVGSLQVDSSAIHADLECACPFSVEEGIAETTSWFKRALS